MLLCKLLIHEHIPLCPQQTNILGVCNQTTTYFSAKLTKLISSNTKHGVNIQCTEYATAFVSLFQLLSFFTFTLFPKLIHFLSNFTKIGKDFDSSLVVLSSRMESISNQLTPRDSGATTPDNHSTVDTLSEQDEGTMTPPSKQTTPATSPQDSFRWDGNIFLFSAILLFLCLVSFRVSFSVCISLVTFFSCLSCDKWQFVITVANK